MAKIRDHLMVVVIVLITLIGLSGTLMAKDRPVRLIDCVKCELGGCMGGYNVGWTSCGTACIEPANCAIV